MECFVISTLWWGNRCLFDIKFPFVQDQVSKVFDGILVYVFHEDFDVIFGDFQVG